MSKIDTLRKKALALLATAVVLILPLQPLSATATGTIVSFIEPPASSIPISSRTQLEAIKNNLDGMFHLAADIDLSGAEWSPIAQAFSNGFTGTLDGQGFVIRNLTVTGNNQFGGLFAVTDGATIKNLGMEGTNIDISYYMNNHAGAIAAYGSATVSNCYNTGNVSAASNSAFIYAAFAGGIIGYGHSAGDITITDCYNTGDISAYSKGHHAYAGGMFAYGDGGYSVNLTIKDCYNTGVISAASASSSAYAGGMYGYGYRHAFTSINNCSNTGDVTVASDYFAHAGGICGSSYSGLVIIADCYSLGDVSAAVPSASSINRAYAGGICGLVGLLGRAVVRNCYVTGDVSASSNAVYSYAGGICGYINLGEVSSCAALCAKVESTSADIGRVVAYHDSSIENLPSNNIAFDGMTVLQNSAAKNPLDTRKDGLDISIAAIAGDGTLVGRFADTAIWTTENSKLPGFGAAIDLPQHLGGSPAEKEPTPTAAIDYNNETLTGLVAGGRYSFNNGTAVVSMGTAYPISANWFGSSVSIVKKGSGTATTDSDAQSLAIPARPGTPVLQGQNETAAGLNNGSISGVDGTMEYSANGTAWTGCPNSTIIGLAPGTYYVRVKATGSSFKSLTSEITISPAATPTSYTVTVIGGSGGGSYTPGAIVTIAATPSSSFLTGQAFTGWTASGATLPTPGSASTSFLMPSNAVTVTAQYDTMIRLWGKTTGHASSFMNWILCIVCFGWIWMAF